MNEFDNHGSNPDDARLDEAIGQRLRSSAAPSANAHAALGALGPRFARAAARSRQRRVAAGGLMASVLVVAAVVFAQPDGAIDVNVNPPAGSDGRSTLPAMSIDTSSSTSIPTTSSTTVAPANPSTPDSTPSSVPSSETVPSATIAVPSRPSTSKPPSAAGSVKPAPSTTTAPPVARRTWASTGGTVMVDVGGGLSLVEHTPAPGFTDQVTQQQPDRIEVRFTSPTFESRIELRWDGSAVSEKIENKAR